MPKSKNRKGHKQKVAKRRKSREQDYNSRINKMKKIIEEAKQKQKNEELSSSNEEE